MSAEQVALAHYRRRARLAAAVAAAVRKMWTRVDPSDIAGSWQKQVAELLVVVVGAQLAAAREADEYLDEVLAEQNLSARATGGVVARALAGVASDGRPLDTLLYRPAIATLASIEAGASVERALAGGLSTLDMVVRTQLADTGRTADQLALTARPRVTGYVRMVVGKTCGRCVILAGRRYHWNTGFLRHPRCDCVHVPAAEDTADDVRTDPRAWFNSLSQEEQNRQFTVAGAQAIRDGANINQVVNARLGAYGLTTPGGVVQATAANTAFRRGGVRLMPEAIYQQAGDNRDEALRLLRRFGYLT